MYYTFKKREIGRGEWTWNRYRGGFCWLKRLRQVYVLAIVRRIRYQLW